MVVKENFVRKPVCLRVLHNVLKVKQPVEVKWHNRTVLLVVPTTQDFEGSRLLVAGLQWHGGCCSGARCLGFVNCACVQVGLGILTLLHYVPTPLAAGHQSGSLALLTLAIWLTHEIKLLKYIPK
ncbi:jg2014 [Pararge aegeria aegeria]|uniref:Jg2014 protein n=1 Tax=Pararge aegeria aegeria TaxID=348720 RepID=A0A8S4S4N9_9NEOP|nr:jg2014 [Pararge aegeria aegeria]